MAAATKFTIIRFNEDVLNLICKQAALDGQTPTEFIRNIVLENLEDSLDYQDAFKIIHESHGKTISREDVKKQLGL